MRPGCSCLHVVFMFIYHQKRRKQKIEKRKNFQTTDNKGRSVIEYHPWQLMAICLCVWFSFRNCACCKRKLNFDSRDVWLWFFFGRRKCFKTKKKKKCLQNPYLNYCCWHLQNVVAIVDEAPVDVSAILDQFHRPTVSAELNYYYYFDRFVAVPTVMKAHLLLTLLMYCLMSYLMNLLEHWNWYRWTDCTFHHLQTNKQTTFNWISANNLLLELCEKFPQKLHWWSFHQPVKTFIFQKFFFLQKSFFGFVYWLILLRFPANFLSWILDYLAKARTNKFHTLVASPNFVYRKWQIQFHTMHNVKFKRMENR